MNTKFLLIPLIFLGLSFQSCTALKTIVEAPTSLESILAVKEVLTSSHVRALNKLRKLNKNGIESLIPDEVGKVLNTMSSLDGLGLGGDFDKIKSSVEKASAIAVEEGSFIIKDAIKQVDLGDAAAIVLQGEDAATAVLRQAMYNTVKTRYSDQMNAELDKSEVKQYWPMAAGAYNLFAKNKVEGELSDFLAERAVDAVFLAMGKEEKEIRKDPAALGSAVVTKVFDYYSKKQKS